MNLSHQLEQKRNEASILPREEKILETIQASSKLFYQNEECHFLTYMEFLWTQLQYTRKRWWAFQGFLLFGAYLLITGMDDALFRARTVGVIGCLFTIIMVPELWRNKSSDSVQVEAACLYSLRQIYSARITLFGIVDVALLTLFCLILGGIGLSLVEVLAQFLLPVTVTACICFSLLCGKANYGETVTITACLFWTGSWWLILMNEQLYIQIAPAVWITVFVIALVFLVLAVRQSVHTTNQYWEVDCCGTAAG